jgi:hypothetical protein
MALMDLNTFSFSIYAYVFIVFSILIDGRQKYDGQIGLFIDARE